MPISPIKFSVILCLALTCVIVGVQAQVASIAILDTGQHCSIRGMSIADDGVVWVSGSNGHVGMSANAGKTWRWMMVAGYEKTDFRDIHAFDSSTAIIMGIGNPAYVLKTRDGGHTWKLVYSKDVNGMFLDAVDFRNKREGICIGDPLDVNAGRSVFFVIRTRDGGDTWSEEPVDKVPQAAQGEAVFSASGTNIALLNSKDFDYAFISGGLFSSLYLVGRNGHPNLVYPLPMAKGIESAGAFSMATDGRKKFFCAGGDYKKPDSVTGNLAWTIDNGTSWKTPRRTQPNGYRSCISMINGDRLVACGPNGVDLYNKLNNWQRISTEGFNVCAVSKDKKLIFFGGAKGRIGVLKL